MQKNRYQNKPTSHEPPPAGTHKAVLVQFIELGMQPGYQGAADEDSVYLSFELPNAMKANAEPFLVGRFYSIKYGVKSNWSMVLKALLGRTPEVGEVITPDDLLGQGCQLVITHNKRDDGSVVGRVESLIPLSHGEETPKADSNLIFYDFEKKPQAVFDLLPEFLKEAISRGKPYLDIIVTTHIAVSDFDDNIPF